MAEVKNAKGEWEIRSALTLERGELFTITRVVNRRRVHFEYASDGRPMLYSRESAEAALSAAEGKKE